jgi:superfamily II DNA or RNA helicase
VTVAIDDQRRQLPPVELTFRGRLKSFQQRAATIMLEKEFGTLSAATGSGKTVMALFMIARRRQPSLVVVHTKDLAFQWMDRIETFLGIPAKQIGLIGAGKRQVGFRVTVALVQSLYRCAGEVSKQIGHLVVDECHRTPSRTFTDAVSAFDARYMLGLTATPWRRDGLARLIFWHLGDVRHEVNKHALIRSGDVMPVEVISRETDFSPYYDPVSEYSRMLSELTADDSRNRLIAADVAREARSAAGVCLVLSDRKKHCETLQAILRYGHKLASALLTGDLTAAQRREVLDRINRGDVRVLVATGQLVGEGLDCRELTTLFIATPVRFSGRLVQYLGRVLRPAPGKKTARVYDYVDVKVDVLKAAANARRRVYDG